MLDANPLRHLSSSWSTHVCGLPAAPLKTPEFDAVVIGSGYGGAVAALRLAQMGWCVTVLERGSEYRPGDFPNDLGMLPKQVRMPTPDGRGVIGRATGLYELRAGVNMVSMVANGVGGGSLINAGVLVEPDDDVFAQSAWPAEIREAGAALEQHFAAARQELSAHSAQPMTMLPKARALADLGSKLVPPRDALPVQFTIDPARCTRCGDCASGCNVEGAKLTLRDTYLRKAVDAGARMFNSATVYKLSRRVAGGAVGGWTLRTVPTEGTSRYRCLSEAALPEADGGIGVDIHARLVVIAAGTFGSTELLQRSRHLEGENLWLSGALGSRLSANGDSLNFCANLPANVNAMGVGADGWSQPSAHRVGPTITTQLDLRTRLARPVGWNAADAARWRPPMQQRLLVQEGAIPGAIGRIFAELLATGYAGTQLGRWAWNPPRDASVDPLSAGHWLQGPQGNAQAARRNQASLSQHTLTLLAMGHDESAGRIVWVADRNSSVPYWVDPAALDTYMHQERVLDAACTAIGGVFTPNPLWRLLPASATALMNGPKPAPAITSVHPLGGCVMGDDPCTSVVDHLGRVWRMEEKRPGCANQPDCVYQDLYVLDGSIVATSLGCNPLLTITMLAERALAQAPLGALRKSLGQWPLPTARARAPMGAAESALTQPIAATRPHPPALPVELNERLVCANLQLTGSLEAARAHADLDLRLTTMDDAAAGTANDWLSMWDDPRHLMRVTGRLRVEVEVEGEQANQADQAIRTWEVRCGTAQLLAVGRQPRPWRWIDARPGRMHGVLHLLEAVWRGLGVALTNRMHLVRVLLTWVVNRCIVPPCPPPERPRPVSIKRPIEALRLGGSWLRSLLHACEIRTMVYDLTLVPADATDGATPPGTLRLRGHKTIDYAADWAELAGWLWGSKRLLLSPLLPVRSDIEQPAYPLLRPSFLEQAGNLHVALHDADGRPVCKPVAFEMDFKDMVGRLPLRVSGDGDLPSALAALAAYPAVFGRFALKTRMYDFRLPEYSGRSVVDNAPEHQTELHSPRGANPIQAESHDFRVPLGRSSNDPADGAVAHQLVAIRLWRYRRPASEAPDTQMRVSSWRGRPVRKLRSVLLVHAFAQSGYSFTLKSVQQNLAEALYHDGRFEVWILEHRLSTRLRAHQQQSTIDQIALYDIPVAVSHILATRAQELGVDPSTLQIQAFAQCIGAAATAMALLRGRLAHAATAPPDAALEPGAPQLPKLCGLFISQTHPFCIGTPLTQARTWIPSMLRDALGLPRVAFAVRQARPDGLQAAADRLFAALPLPANELCPPRRKVGHAHEGDYDEDDCATCRRLRFIEAPMFKHANLNYETHRDLPLLFGDANVRLFAHAAKCVDAERLVTEDGAHLYVHDAAVHRQLNLPICFLHGADNELFDKESAVRSAAQYARIHPRWADRVADSLQRAGDQSPARASWIVPGYGHVDVLIGKDAHRDVFPPIVKCMRAWHELDDPDTAAQADTPRRCAAARVPLGGPFIGSVRRLASGPQVCVGLSFRIDDRFSDGKSGSDAAPGTRTWAFASIKPTGDAGCEQMFALQIEATSVRSPVTGEIERPTGQDLSTARMAHGELPVNLGADCEATDLEITCFSVHEALVAPQTTLPADLSPLHASLALAAPAPGAVPDEPLSAWLRALLAQRRDRLLTLARDDRPCRHTVSFFRLKPESFERRVSAKVLKASIEALAPRPGCEKTSVAFAVGSCRYPGFRFELPRVDAWLASFESLCADGPVAFGLLLGDQIYADATAGFADELSPVERYLVRHQFAFARRRTAQAPPNGFGDWLAGLPVVMTPDDHEFADGYPDGRPLSKARPQQMETAQMPARHAAIDALRAYQRLQCMALQTAPGVWQFDAGPVRVLVLDTRSDRRPSDGREAGPNSILSTTQLAALQAWLNRPDAFARLNVIATGSVVLPGLTLQTDPGNPGPVDTLQANPHDRDALLGQLAAAHRTHPDAFRVLLLSGDYHLATAAYLCAGRQRFGACITAPPLYSPMPFLNLAAHRLWFDEPLAHGLSVAPALGTHARSVWHGNGMGRLRVDRAGRCADARYTVAYDAKLRALDRYQNGAAEPFEVSLTL